MSFTPSTSFQFTKNWTGIPRFQWPELTEYFVWFDSTFPEWTSDIRITTPNIIQYSEAFPIWIGGFYISSLRVDLKFDEAFPDWSGDVQITLPRLISFEEILPAWSGNVRIETPTKVVVSGTWPFNLAGSVDLSISLNVSRPSISLICVTQDSEYRSIDMAGVGAALARRSSSTIAHLSDALSVTASLTGTTRDLSRLDSSMTGAVMDARPIGAGLTAATRDLSRLDSSMMGAVIDARPIGAGLTAATRDLSRLDSPVMGTVMDALPIGAGRMGAIRVGRFASLPWAGGLRDARILSTANWRADIEYLPFPPLEWGNKNVWKFRWFNFVPNRPVFIWPDIWGQRIPIKEVYIVTTSATLFRLSDGAEIDTTSFEVKADMDSSYWRLSANLIGRTAYNLLQPINNEPIEVCLRISGCPDWYFLVDRITGNLKFFGETFNLSGRSLNALLGPGWARARTRTEDAARNRRQLADYELNLTGWEIDPWNVPDWLIPGGVWSYQGQTPIEVLRLLSEVDGFVLPHPNLQKIGIYPRYKVLPWDWADAVPDLILPASVITSFGIEPRFTRNAGLGWNAIYVRGESGGFWKVKREDTVGDIVPDEALVSSLMTHVDGARSWASRWLADAEPLFRESLELPLAPANGIPLLEFGSLLEYGTTMGTWRGIISDLGISGSLDGNALVINQKIMVERYGE